jgi:glucose/arabinose dehydrogenase
MRRILVWMVIGSVLAACGSQSTAQAFQATVPGESNSAPVYTATPTATDTPTVTPSLTPTNTPTPTLTLSPTPTLTSTLTPTPTDTPTQTPSPTLTPSLTPTPPLATLTSVPDGDGPSAIDLSSAALPLDAGWSCNVNPCPDDVEGWLRYISVPEGFAVSHVGQLPGSPQQITYGPDGYLYATVHQGSDPTNGAIYVLAPETGEASLYSEGLVSPVGLAFQPGTDVLYVSARETLDGGGAIYRIPSEGGAPNPVLVGLPCCWREIDNQVNGMVFGPDGFLYLGVSSLTDHAESPNPSSQAFGEVGEFEAAVLRIQPHTGNYEVFAQGIRHPFDLTFDRNGQFYATDSGVLSGPGDRILNLMPDGHYRFPYWREFGCVECPPTRRDIDYQDHLLQLPDFTLPRGIVAYSGTAFPSNLHDDLFVALWHDNGFGRMIAHLDPATIPEDPEERAVFLPTPFVTGLLRPIDVVITPDGGLAIADWATGHVWRVDYTG